MYKGLSKRPIKFLVKPFFQFGKKILRDYQRKRRIREYAGYKVECPFCRMLFDRFRPSGALERPFWCSDEGRRLLAIDWIGVANAICPNCGSGERHRLLWFYLRDNRDNFLPGARVLDIAPDKFIYKAFFKNANIDYRSIDINSNRNPTHLMDITDLKFDDASFDLILCSHVLEHIQDDLKAAQEICRVLKPTGIAIIQVPIWAEKTVEDKTIANPEARSAHFGHPDHVRRYGPDFAGRIREAGLEVTLDNYATKLSCDILTRFGIHKYETLHICRRS